MFWDLFDFNGDGQVDAGEEALGFMIMNECMKEEEDEDDDKGDDDL